MPNPLSPIAHHFQIAFFILFCTPVASHGAMQNLVVTRITFCPGHDRVDVHRGRFHMQVGPVDVGRHRFENSFSESVPKHVQKTSKRYGFRPGRSPPTSVRESSFEFRSPPTSVSAGHVESRSRPTSGMPVVDIRNVQQTRSDNATSVISMLPRPFLYSTYVTLYCQKLLKVLQRAGSRMILCFHASCRGRAIVGAFRNSHCCCF